MRGDRDMKTGMRRGNRLNVQLTKKRALSAARRYGSCLKRRQNSLGVSSRHLPF